MRDSPLLLVLMICITEGKRNSSITGLQNAMFVMEREQQVMVVYKNVNIVMELASLQTLCIVGTLYFKAQHLVPIVVVLEKS